MGFFSRLILWFWGWEPSPQPTAPEQMIGWDEIPDEALVLPVRDFVLFPAGMYPLTVIRADLFALVDEALAKRDGFLVVVTQRNLAADTSSPSDLYGVGTLGRIVEVGPRTAAGQDIVVQGLERVRTSWYPKDKPPLVAQIIPVMTANAKFEGVIEAAEALRGVARKLTARLPNLPPEASTLINTIENPSHLTDLLIANLDLAVEEKQRVLESTDLRTRMQITTTLLTTKLAATAPALKVVPDP